MPSNLHDVIKVCDQVEHNHLELAPTAHDLAKSAHRAFQRHGLDVSEADCQRAAEQVLEASSSPVVAGSYQDTPDKRGLAPPVSRRHPVSVAISALSSVVAVGTGWWGWIHISQPLMTQILSSGDAIYPGMTALQHAVTSMGFAFRAYFFINIAVQLLRVVVAVASNEQRPDHGSP